MKNRVIAFLLCMCLLAAVPAVQAEEDKRIDVVFKPREPVTEQTKGEDEEKSALDKIKDANSALLDSLIKKDWEALAAEVKRTGKWRDDIVAVVKSQVGYQEEAGGMTLYTRWAGEKLPVSAWTALFVNWAAAQIGLTEKQFPQGATYQEVWEKMEQVRALKKISWAHYPASGDLALIEKEGQQLVGVVLYVSDGYAAVVCGDDHGKVNRFTQRVGSDGFTHYVDLDVLMARAGIKVGKGGKVPVIPEGGVPAWTNTEAVYIREKPTRVSKSLTILYQARTPLVVTSAAKQEDGYIWYGIEYKQYVGYIRSDLVDLDKSALATATPSPAPTAAPTPVPGCVICAQAAGNVSLPVVCCHAQLAAMTAEEAARFMAELMTDDPAVFALYIRCDRAHVRQGDGALICLDDDCGDAAWSAPGEGHHAKCPWYKEGLQTQVRQTKLETRAVQAGQTVMILHEVSGASTHQWYEVKTVVQADGTVTREEKKLTGERAASLLVTAKYEKNTTYGYYCVATIVSAGESVEVRGKTTQLQVTGESRAAEVKTTLTITCSGLQAGESTILVVASQADASQCWTVAVQNGGSVTLDGLTAGEGYTIATAEGWAWRYQPISQEVTAQAGGAQVNLVHTQTNERWMSCESSR